MAESEQAEHSPSPDGDKDRKKPPKPTTIVLVRHAVTEQTGPILSGRTPGIDLSEKGRGQASAVAERLAALPVTAVYSSPIERTWQTATAIADRHGLDVRRLSGMIEADYGEWTGGKIEDLAKSALWKVVQAAPSAARFPGGESIREMQSRAVAAVERVIKENRGNLVVVVSHSDVIKAAVAHFAGIHLDLFQRIVISPASVTVLVFGLFGAALFKLNDNGTLDELMPGSEAPSPGEDAVEVPSDG